MIQGKNMRRRHHSCSSSLKNHFQSFDSDDNFILRILQLEIIASLFVWSRIVIRPPKEPISHSLRKVEPFVQIQFQCFCWDWNIFPSLQWTLNRNQFSWYNFVHSTECLSFSPPALASSDLSYFTFAFILRSRLYFHEMQNIKYSKLWRHLDITVSTPHHTTHIFPLNVNILFVVCIEDNRQTLCELLTQQMFNIKFNIERVSDFAHFIFCVCVFCATKYSARR